MTLEAPVVRRALTVAAVLLLAVWVGTSVGEETPLFWAVVTVCCLGVIGATRFECEKIFIILFLAEAGTHLTKRMLFLSPAPPLDIYYQIQAIPLIVLGLAAISARKEFSLAKIGLEGWTIAGFMALGTGLTILRTGSSGVVGVLISVATTVLPMAAYYIGTVMTIERLRRLAPTIVALGVIASVYGMWQFAFGPTYVDQKWARYLGGNSIQGWKVLAFIEGMTKEFRPFSFFAEPLVYGLFLVFGMACAMTFQSAGKAFVRAVALVILVGGLVTTLSRSPILAALVMALVAWLLRFRAWRRGWVFVMLGSIGVFVTVFVINYLVENIARTGLMPQFSTQFLDRMLNIGTLTQRGYALDEMSRAIANYGVFGGGWLEMGAMTRPVEGGQVMFESHNGLVAILIAVGVPGALLLGAAIWLWLNRVMRCLQSTSDEGVATAVRWYTGMTVGYVATACFSGHQFLASMDMWFVVGAITGVATRSKRPAAGGGDEKPA
jgi:hypothetical protein